MQKVRGGPGSCSLGTSEQERESGIKYTFSIHIIALQSYWQYNKTVSSSVSFIHIMATGQSQAPLTLAAAHKKLILRKWIKVKNRKKKSERSIYGNQ